MNYRSSIYSIYMCMNYYYFRQILLQRKKKIPQRSVFGVYYTIMFMDVPICYVDEHQYISIVDGDVE